MFGLKQAVIALSFAVVGAVATVSAVAIADPPRPSCAREEIANVLDENKQTALRELMKAHRDQMRDLRDEAGDDREALTEAFAEGKSTSPEVHAAIDEAFAARAEVAHRFANDMLAFSATLTPEERAALADNLPFFDGPPPHKRHGMRGQGCGQPGMDADMQTPCGQGPGKGRGRAGR